MTQQREAETNLRTAMPGRLETRSRGKGTLQRDRNRNRQCAYTTEDSIPTTMDWSGVKKIEVYGASNVDGGVIFLGFRF